MTNKSEVKTSPCPHCGEPLIEGYMHAECEGIEATARVIEIPGIGEVISFPTGTSLDDILNHILGHKPLYVHAEQFDFSTHDGRMTINLNVTDLNAAIARAEVEFKCVTDNLNVDILEDLIKDRANLNGRHVMSMKPERIAEPVVFIEVEDGKEEYLLADGRHRYLAKMLHLQSEVTCYLVPFAAWQPFGKVTIHQEAENGQS